MKSISIVSFAICLLAFTTGCQQEEVAPLKVGEPSLVQGGEFTPVVHHRSIPPDQEIRTDYRGATKWRITFNEPKIEICMPLFKIWIKNTIWNCWCQINEHITLVPFTI